MVGGEVGRCRSVGVSECRRVGVGPWWGEAVEKGRCMVAVVKSFKELRVWQNAMDLAMRVFELTRRFPVEERYSLTDQVRRSSRSVAANISEAWRKRRYRAAFVSKLSDAESEAAETQTWVEMAVRCGYWTEETAKGLDCSCEEILGQLVSMIGQASRWCDMRAPRRQSNGYADTPIPRHSDT